MSRTSIVGRAKVGAGLLAAALMAVWSFAPASAQGEVNDCSGLTGAEEIACLRQALSQTQEALLRAERALEAAETVQAVSPPAPAETLGEEQAARRAGVAPPAREEQRFTALIVASERTHPNRLQVHLENGQIWRQIQGDTQIVELPRDARMQAEISRSRFGGYRMRLRGIGRILKVERLL